MSFGVTESVDIQSLADQTGTAIIPSAWHITELTTEAERQVSQIVASI